ncbi:MAG: ABC transporter permease, partial [Acidobacteriota bacterium]
MSWTSRIANVFRSRRLSAELDEEFRFHLEERIDHLVAGGMNRQEAEEQARRQFGNRLRLRETSQDVRSSVWLDSFFQDIRFACRVLWKDRGAMGAAVLSLTLALGACSTAFSLIDALLLRPLPVSHPESLVYAAWPDPQMNAPPGIRREHDSFSYPLFQRFQQAAPPGADLFGAVLGGGPRPAAFGVSEETEPVRVQGLSGNAFDVFGIQPAIGRLFTAGDDTYASSPVAILSYPFWNRRFAADPAVLGRPVTLAGKQLRIVGVARKGFDGLEPGYLADLWIPVTALADAKTLASPDATWVNVWGRTNRGDNPGSGNLAASLQVAFTNFRRAHTQGNVRPGATPEQIASFVHTPLLLHAAANGADSLFRRQFRHPLWIFGIFSG